MVPAMGRCGIRPSQNGLSKLVPAMGRCGIRLVFLGRQYATLEIRGVALGRHVGHDSCCCSAVSEPAKMDSQSWFLQWVGVAEALFF